MKVVLTKADEEMMKTDGFTSSDIKKIKKIMNDRCYEIYAEIRNDYFSSPYGMRW